jgi:hypothetical protein
METNNKPHRLAGEPAASFNMDLRNCRAALLLIWFISGRPSFHADEGHFFGQLRNQSRVLGERLWLLGNDIHVIS